MGGQAIEAIIFDLGRVILDFDHAIAAERIAKFSDKGAGEIFELFFDSPLTESFEEGRILPGGFFGEIKKMLKLRIDYGEFVPIWNEIFFFSEKNLAAYNLARELKEKYRVALVSNINILHFEYIKRTFPILDAFHNVVTSYETGFRKPKEQIYRHALKALNVTGRQCFYTDDRADLVAAAGGLGIRGYVFNGIGQLKADLCSEGIGAA